MAQPIPPVILAPVDDLDRERQWLEQSLAELLDSEYIPEAVNSTIARYAANAYIRQRMEGENDIDGITIAILTEMQGFDFSKSFFGEFAIANAVSELLLDRMGIEPCCGRAQFRQPDAA
jgi:hypothetical protein